MKVEKIKVTAGRVRPHPIQSYSSVRPEVTLEATVEDGEDWQEAVATLQQQAERIVEDHANLLHIQLIRISKMEKFKDRVLISLQEVLCRAVENLKIARAKAPHKTVFHEMDTPGNPVTGNHSEES